MTDQREHQRDGLFGWARYTKGQVRTFRTYLAKFRTYLPDDDARDEQVARLLDQSETLYALAAIIQTKADEARYGDLDKFVAMIPEHESTLRRVRSELAELEQRLRVMHR